MTFGIFFFSFNRDIKGANLLVDSSGVVKLADFGMAKHVSSFSSSLLLYHLVFCFLILHSGSLLMWSFFHLHLVDGISSSSSSSCI